MADNDLVVDFAVGDLVWAKMKGYPPWPGKIVLVTIPFDGMKKSGKKNSKCIYFFGTDNYSWIEIKWLKPYLPLSDELLNRSKSKSFKNACKAIESYILENQKPRTPKSNYSEHLSYDDEEFESVGSFNIQDILKKDCSVHNFVKEMNGEDLKHSFFIEKKFIVPLLFKNKSGLGLKVPHATFSVSDICRCVGSSRKVNVIDVERKKDITMTMKEWTKYFEAPIKIKILNVISLEFSHTKLDHYVKRPNIVEKLDWVDCVWPKHLKESRTESTNLISSTKYPKVQKYCLMSAKGSYTDFHIDFGGTSVWYHILKGKKIFWLIPPTVRNFEFYKLWVSSDIPGNTFFGDMVEDFNRVELEAGNTVFLPSGWIHAVYTPEDSIVFGGNFLHMFDVENQLAVAQIEKSTKIPEQFTYPFFTEILWYVLKRYVDCDLSDSPLKEGNTNVPSPVEHCCFTELELYGLKAIVKYLGELPPHEKCIPFSEKNGFKLMEKVSIMLTKHCNDSELETRTIFLLPTTKNKNNAIKIKKTPKNVYKVARTAGSVSRKRRTRCKKCEACLKDNCRRCAYCIDMVKYGGPGRVKQSCVERQCLQPMLPTSATCELCSLDGWGQQISKTIQKTADDTPSNLMECCLCYQIVHPDCLFNQAVFTNAGNYKDDLPNSWDCPKCCVNGKNLENKGRFFLARPKLLNIRQQLAVSNNDIQNNLENENAYSENESSSDSLVNENAYSENESLFDSLVNENAYSENESSSNSLENESAHSENDSSPDSLVNENAYSENESPSNSLENESAHSENDSSDSSRRFTLTDWWNPEEEENINDFFLM